MKTELSVERCLELFGGKTNIKSIKRFLDTGGSLRDYCIRSMDIAPHIHTTILNLICINNTDVNIIKFCIKRGGNLNIISEIKLRNNIVTRTPFYMLCFVHYRTMTKKLLKICINGGADLITEHDGGISPLSLIRYSNNKLKLFDYIYKKNLIAKEKLLELNIFTKDVYTAYCEEGTQVNKNDLDYKIY